MKLRAAACASVRFNGTADEQFSFAPQIDLQDHKTVRVSFRMGDGPLTTISTPWEI
jgi:hypothetical protein